MVLVRCGKASAIRPADSERGYEGCGGDVIRWFYIVCDGMMDAMGYRWAPVMSYRLLFTVDEAYREVTIERVLHGSQN